ncbi:hypothetical protein MKW92_032863 [Papaver armeniacum]|nr:hypothetical protein MKW92_032863 [Papaver armeniacum]
MFTKELSNDGNNRSQGEMTEIKGLLQVLIQSQSRLAEAQAQQASIQNQMLQQAKCQEIIQIQMLEVLRNNSAGNKQQALIQKIICIEESGCGGEENQPSKVEEKVLRAIYNPNRSDLLVEGDCEKTIEFLNNNHEALKHGITGDSYTVLHVAIGRIREIRLIKEIVKLMSPELLEYRGGDDDSTALHYAAQYGNAEVVQLLISKNPRLPLLLDNRGMTPLDIALHNVSIDQKEVVEYLYSVTKDVHPSPFSGSNGAYTLCRLIEANFYDIALCVVKKFPEAALTKSNGTCGLEMMVRRPFSFKSSAKLTWCQNLIYSSIQVDMNSTCIQLVEPAECTIRDEENPLKENLDGAEVAESLEFSSSTTSDGIIMSYIRRAIAIEQLYSQKLVHQQAVALIKQILLEICRSTLLLSFLNNNPNIMKIAIKHGIIEFIALCLEKNHHLIFDKISGETMIKMAITERKETIVSLICQTSDKLGQKMDMVSRKDLDKNTILHYAANLAPFAQLSLVSGAALQMQREMQWFMGIKSIIRESDRFTRNKEGNTAQFIFTEEHKELVKEGQDWLKDTSRSCMIVAALIATVAFAAAFNVPGGNINDTKNPRNGTPIFLGKSSLTVFAVADTLALFSSITSVLMFLAMHTSRYAEMDFLKSLPQKLIFGLATLFISMVAILVAFGASLFILVGNRFSLVPIPMALLSCCPLGLFAWLQLPLFIEMLRSTYWGSLFQKHRYIDLSSTKNGNKLRKKKKEN